MLADARAAMASGDKGAIAKAAQGAWSRFSALFASFGDFGPALAK